MEIYDIAETTVETTEKSHPKTRAREVEREFDHLLNTDVNLVEPMSVASHIDGFTGDEGVILEMSDYANKVVYHGFGYFSLNENLADYFGESEGSANVVGQVVKHDLSLRQVMAILIDNGDMRRAVNEVAQMRAESDPDTMTIIGYMFLKYSLGWDAERILSQSDDFSKGNTAQDQGGIDGWWFGEERQVRPVTWAGSYGRKKAMQEDRDFAVYVWDCDGGLRVCDLPEMLDMLGEVADENGLYKSNLYSSKRMKTAGMKRAFRYFWW